MEQMKTTPEQEPVCCCHKKKERDEKEYKDLMNRLSRIEGTGTRRERECLREMHTVWTF